MEQFPGIDKIFGRGRRLSYEPASVRRHVIVLIQLPKKKARPKGRA
jgi:hypothetical protein